MRTSVKVIFVALLVAIFTLSSYGAAPKKINKNSLAGKTFVQQAENVMSYGIVVFVDNKRGSTVEVSAKGTTPEIGFNYVLNGNILSMTTGFGTITGTITWLSKNKFKFTYLNGKVEFYALRGSEEDYMS